jgi:hypothetical protein
VKLEVWLSDPACVPSSLAVLAAPEKVAFRVDVAAPESGWAKSRWHSLSLRIPRAAYPDPLATAWADLAKLQLDYSCREPPAAEAFIKVGARSRGQAGLPSAHPPPPVLSWRQVQLVRICKELPQPSYCVVESTDVYKTDCRECNCQTCHDCSCIPLLTGHCLYDSCNECLGAPILKCCYSEDCGRKCNCETCCESRPFLSCSKAISYGVASISPTAGPEEGGTTGAWPAQKGKPWKTTILADFAQSLLAAVVVHASSAFVETPHLACRFGAATVQATLLSPQKIQCVSPELPGLKNRSVPVEVSLDGQRWTHNAQV